MTHHHCFACEFARALLMAVGLMIALIIVAAVCMTGAHGSDVVMNRSSSNNAMDTGEFVVILVAAAAAAVMVVVANAREDKQ